MVRAHSADAAVRTARALAAGGIRESRSPTPRPTRPAAIAELADDDELFVGAGTVLTGDEAEQAIQAGAEFIVCPSLSLPVLERGRDASVLTIPGALTPTELALASQHAR